MCARRFDQVAHLGPLVAGEIVHDDNVARPQRRGEKLLDVSFEDLGVDRPIEDEWGDDFFEPQCGHESRRFPMAVRDRGAQAFPFGSATASSRHVRGGPGLVDENELLRIKIELGFEPSPTALQDIWPILLGRVRRLFLSVTPLRAKKRESAEMLNEWPAAYKTPRISAMRGVSLGSEQGKDESRLGLNGHRPTISSLALGRYIACRKRLRHPSDRAGRPNLEMRRSLTPGHAAIDCINHTLAKVGR